ncbi:MAG: hypothetical protein ACT4PP_04315 [Sporichthyaceae bacterium]
MLHMPVLPGVNEINPLPGAAMIIAATVERGAMLGMAFDSVDLVTLEDLTAVLTLRGSETACVVITAVSTRGGRLAGALAQVRTHCPPGVAVYIDVSGPGGPDLLRDGGAALRGFRTRGWAVLWDIACLALTAAPSPDEVPDLAFLAELRAAKTGPATTDPPACAPSSSESATPDRSAPAPPISATARRRSAGSRSVGLATRRTLRVAAAGGAAWVAVAVILAIATDSGFSGFALTVLIGVLAAGVLDSLRGRIALARRLDQISAAVRERGAPAGDGTSMAKLSKQLGQVNVRLTEIEQDVAIIAASTVDTARSVARLHTEPAAQGPASATPRP